MLLLDALRKQGRRLSLHADYVARADLIGFHRIGLHRIQREYQIQWRDIGDDRQADYIVGGKFLEVAVRGF